MSAVVEFLGLALIKALLALCVAIVLVYLTVFTIIRLFFFWATDPRVVMRDYFREVQEWLSITLRIS